ncbi:inositol monophosphatase family protein [Buchnera aphidicola]|uniref:inositol monophosphatase family protein n=1 Tax=Buchnera aphidicola TaxID=9 RepID=UPI003464DBBE
MHPMLNIAIRAVRKGGNFVIQNYDTYNFFQDSIEKKQNIVQDIMYKTNKIISDIISKSYPHHVILNKNIYTPMKKNENIYWIVNELDGQYNFLKNFPHFCVSIAIVIKNITEISVIYDPIRNDLFTSVKGQGTQLNGRRIRCTNINGLESTTAAVNLPHYLKHSSFAYFEIYKILILSGISFLCTGSTVLDLAYVAAGRIDCLFDFNLHSGSFVAGKLQAREAGCLISNLKGGHESITDHSSNIISSPKCIRLVMEKIREYCRA